MMLKVHVLQVDALEVHFAQDLGVEHDVGFEFFNLKLKNWQIVQKKKKKPDCIY